MPNTPALIGAGASGFCLGPNVRGSDEALVLVVPELGRPGVSGSGSRCSMP